MGKRTIQSRWIRRTIKSLLWIFIGLVVLLVGLLVFGDSFRSDLTGIKPLCHSPEALINLPSNIKTPPDLREPVLAALAHFPELKSARITFRYASISATMNAQPVFNKAIFSRDNREYVIRVNDNRGEVTTLQFASVPPDIQEGWIGHELGHILDYQQRSTFSILGLGVNYLLSERFKQHIELFADRAAVFKGLGEESAEGMEYVFSFAELSPEYLQHLRENYLSAEELRTLNAEYTQACQLEQ